MGPIITIDSLSDHRVGDYRNLTDAALRRGAPAARAKPGSFIVEGVRAIRELIRSAYPVRSLLLSASRLERLAADLEGITAPVYLATRATMAEIVGFDVHRGALASAERLPPPPLDDVVAGARLLAVVEGVNDHENLGALFRNAAAFGVGGVLLCPSTADPLYRRSVRVSLGKVLHVPWTWIVPWPGALEGLRAAGFELIALTPDPAAMPLEQLPARTRCAVLVGAEEPGLSEPALAAADRMVRIPMCGGVDSINVATAAAIAFYHLAFAARPPPAVRPGSGR